MKRPLFWIGLTFLSSTAVFLRFSAAAAIFSAVVIAAAASFLAAERFSLHRVLLFLAAALFAGGWLYLRGAVSARYLAPVTDTSSEYAVMTAAVTDCRPSSGYQTLSAHCDITVNNITRTADVKLSGYFSEAPRRGDIIRCLAAYDNGRYIIKRFIEHDGAAAHPFITVRSAIQNRISQKLGELFDESSCGILSALLVGDDSMLDSDTVSAFRRSSLSHLLVVSGMHLLIISHSLSLLLGRFLSERVSSAVSLLFCWGFAALSGFGVSIVRAALMLTIINVGSLIGRKSDTLTSLMTAAIVIVLPAPQTVTSASFLLSFSAVAGLALLQKPIFELFRHDNAKPAAKYIFENASSSAAAQLATAPVCALLFKTVPLLGVFANLAAVWLLQPIMALGILALISGSLFPVLAFPFIFVCQKLIALLLAIAGSFGSLPFTTLHFIERWQVAWLFGAVILSVIIICRMRSANAAGAAVTALSAVYLIASIFNFALNFNSADIVIFDKSGCVSVIKGGHAVLLGSPEDKWQRFEIDSAFSTLGVEQLDAIIITDSRSACYQTFKLAKDHSCRFLCAPNDRTSAAFCHSASMSLCQLPQSSPLFGDMTLNITDDRCEIIFKNGKLLKSGGNCDIIGRYSDPMPIEGLARYRVNI